MARPSHLVAVYVDGAVLVSGQKFPFLERISYGWVFHRVSDIAWALANAVMRVHADDETDTLSRNDANTNICR